MAASIYIEVRVASHRVVDSPEAPYRAMEEAIETATSMLERDRFASMTRTANTVMAVLLLSNNDNFHQADLNHVERIARTI